MRRLRLSWSRRPRLTRNGLYVLTLTVMAAQVAFVTGNNLFWFLFASGASLLLSNAWLGWRGLRKLSLRRNLPQTAFAWEAFAGSYLVTNPGRLPAFYVIFEDPPETPRVASEGESRPIFAFAASIAPRTTATVPFSTRLTIRGWNRFTRVRISSDFPFGFFRVSRDIEVRDEILVYPRVGRVLRSLPMERAADGAMFVNRRSQPGEDDFAGLHEWRPGDNPKAIHWPSYGRYPDNRILVREYERTRVPRACLLIDRESKSDRRFEQVVSFTAANLLDLHKNGVSTALWTGSGDSLGASVPEALLTELATLQREEPPQGGAPRQDMEQAVAAAVAAGDLPVVVGDGTRKRHKESAWARDVVLVDVAAADFRGRYQVRPEKAAP
ncbi:MAG: DUF58 domain-containing protein [Planctomycetes bacterium]|nr:DUF58 domain-containing protein [Planctomycetota bacterium]